MHLQLVTLYGHYLYLPLHLFNMICQELGVTDAWQKAVVELGVIPVEGQCIEVLHTAARCGLPDLAMHALQVLFGLEVPLEEHHLAPVLEAFCERRMIEEAFSIVNLMRSSDVQFTQETALPLTNCICGHIDQVDEAWSILEKMHQEHKPVDVVSLNAIIHAAAILNDLQRAIGTYKAFANFDVQPTISTFNYLLSGCISASHRELGDKLLSELRELHLIPDTKTFERMIILCLTQTVYEDAFFYLEEMKGQGYLPPLSVYTALIRKCVVSGDVRWKIALDEMKECGFEVSPALQIFIDTGGNSRTKA
jgi:pentatricopeptide repeat protein